MSDYSDAIERVRRYVESCLRRKLKDKPPDPDVNEGVVEALASLQTMLTFEARRNDVRGELLVLISAECQREPVDVDRIRMLAFLGLSPDSDLALSYIARENR